MNPRVLKNKCLEEIKKRISIPEKNEHLITDDVHRIRYSIDKQINHIVLDDLDLAEVLLELNMIQSAELLPDHTVAMYRQWYEPTDIQRSGFKQEIKKARVMRDQITFTEEDLINIAASHELKKVGGVMGLFTAKIIPITTFLAA